jgi:hypothetical protein
MRANRAARSIYQRSCPKGRVPGIFFLLDHRNLAGKINAGGWGR